MATLKDQFQTRKQESENSIRDLYGKQLAATQQKLTTAHDQELSDLSAARDQISPAYRQKANNLAAAYERNRRNMMLSGLVNGLANGTAQQAQNALRDRYVKEYGDLQGQQAADLTNYDRKIANLNQAYNTNMAQAAMQNQNDLSAALIKDRQQQNDWYAEQAKTLAQYGDFSAYASIYGPEAAEAMRKAWVVKNPLLAYRTGALSAAEYERMTGTAPV